MPKNRMTFSDPRDVLPPITIEALKDDVLRFTQVDRAGRTNIVLLSPRHGITHGVIVADGAEKRSATRL